MDTLPKIEPNINQDIEWFNFQIERAKNPEQKNKFINMKNLLIKIKRNIQINKIL